MDTAAVIAEAERLHAVQDPDSEPYASKYKARELLARHHAQLVAGSRESGGSTAADAHADVVDHVQADLGRIEHLLGVNLVETEEFSAGEAKLMSCIGRLKAEPLRFTAELMGANNQLGILWCNRSEHAKAAQFLDESVRLYDLRKAHEQKLDDVGRQRTAEAESSMAAVESLYTHTVFYCAQVQGHLGNADASARFCHLTLGRQLESKEYNAYEWSTNAVGLAQYYQNCGALEQAYQCLDAADTMLRTLPPVPADGDEAEESGRRRATLKRAWGNFFLGWLKSSAEAELQRRDGDGTAPDAGQPAPDATRSVLQVFPRLQLADPPPCGPLLDFKAASAVFVKGLSALTQALEFFVLDGFVTEHVEILQSMSALYQNLAVFETDASRVCKMHKRRIHLLEHVVMDLNPGIFQNFFRQMTDEIARVYAEMVQLKLSQMRSAGACTEAASQKVNQLALSSIKFHQLFLRSFNDKDGHEPAALDEDLLRPYLNARFTVAMMLTKLYAEDVKAMVDFHSKALEEYQGIVKWLQRSGGSALARERDIAAQMCELLPLKMQKMRLSGRAFREWEF